VLALISTLSTFAAASFKPLPYSNPFPPAATPGVTTYSQPASTVILNEAVTGATLPFTRALPGGWQSGMGGITIEFWLKQKAASTGNPQLDNPDGTIVHGPGFFLEANWLFGGGPGSLLATFSQVKGGAFVANRPISLAFEPSDQQWHQYVLTYDLRTVRIYRDGDLVDYKWLDNNTDRLGPLEDDSGSILTSVIEVGGGGVTSGRRFGNAFLEGVRVSNIALDPWQVRRNFENARSYTTIYVAPGASGSGSSTNSPASLTSALGQVGANKRIILQPGTYNGSEFQVTRSAASQKEHCLIIGADGSSPAIISGGTPTLSGAHYVTLRNLTFSSDAGTALTVNNSTGVIIDSCRISGSQRGIVANSSSKIAVQNNVVNVGNVGIQLGGSPYNIVRNNTVVNGTVGLQLDSGANNASVLNNLFSGQSSASMVVNNGAQQWYRGNGNLFNPGSGTAVSLNGVNYSPAQVRDKSLAQAWYNQDKADKSDNNSRRTGYAAEAQSMAFAPIFVDAANGDFRLSASFGNALDAGAERTFQRAIISPACDSLGTPRPQGNGYDVGAFEGVGAAYSIFNLDADYTTSAGAYKQDGTLVKTIFSNRRLGAGTNVVFWNGLDDNNQPVASGTYTIKMIAHNVQYIWENVVGNSSVPNSGESVHNGFEPMKAMAFNGTAGFYTSGYNENHYELNRFEMSNPNKLTKIFGPKTTITTDSITDIAADGANLYGMNSSSVAVYSQSSHSLTRTINTGGGNSFVEVQRNGSLLFVAKKSQNTIAIYDKNGGNQTGSISVNQPGDLSVTASGDLWVVTGNSVVRYAVNSGGGSAAQTIGGFGNPIAVACSPVDGTVLVADASTWQVKAYNSGGGALWTHGQAGGYANGPRVTNDKFYWAFIDQGRTQIHTVLQFQPDGTWWVGDTFLSRTLHFDMARNLLHEIDYQPHTYMASVDANNGARVFNRFTEYHVDYSKPPQQAWKITNFWGYGLPSYSYGFDDGLASVITFSNGKTFALSYDGGAGNTRVLVELTATGLRETGQRGFGNYTRIQKDGSIYGQSGNGPQTYWKKPLTGFNGAGEPQWGGQQTIATANVGNGFLTSDPLSERFPLLTTNNIVVVHDPARRTGFHLGGIRQGGSTWLWKAMPTIGGHDGNGCAESWIEYGGNYHMVAGRNIFTGFHGEFYQDAGQSGQFFHYYDNGLFVGQFGQPLMFGVVVNPPGGSGNSFAPALVETANGTFLYHNDEPGRGSHRWRMDNLSSLRELAANATIGQAPFTNNPSSGTSTNSTGAVDLVVTALSTTPANPAVGDPVRFNATIKNQGTIASPADATLGIGFSVNGTVQAWWFTTLTSLAPGETLSITSNDGPNGGVWVATAGTHTIVANVDDANRIAESNEANNTMTLTLTPTGGGGTTNSTPTVTIAAAANGTEGGAMGVFNFTRSGATTGALTVNFTVGGSATSGADYASLGTSVTIPVGATNKTLNVGVVDDAAVEGSENVVVTLASGIGYAIGSPSSATVTIADNEQAGTNAAPTVKLSMVNGKMVLNWNSVSGKTYQVCYKNSLTNSSWTPLGSPVTATNTTASYTDNPIPVGVKLRFYGVREQ